MSFVISLTLLLYLSVIQVLHPILICKIPINTRLRNKDRLFLNDDVGLIGNVFSLFILGVLRLVDVLVVVDIVKLLVGHKQDGEAVNELLYDKDEQRNETDENR